MIEAKVSVIIPVYNTEKYLKDCLDSLLGQSFQNFEAILIDDGSGDQSSAICDEYQKKDFRIKVIHQKNQGVSVARNRGIEEAKGEWIFFLDSDDILPENALKNLIEQNSDFVIGSIEEIDEDGNYNGICNSIPKKELNKRQTLNILFDESLYGYQGYLWNKLYRYAIIRDNKITFDSSIKYNEDRLFITEYLLYCSKITMIPQIIYYYRQREGSALGQIKQEFKPAVLSELDAFEKMKKLLKKDYYEIYQMISRLIFEKALYWFSKTHKSFTFERKQLKEMIYNNAKICLKIPGKGLFYKTKVIAHCILKR